MNFLQNIPSVRAVLTVLFRRNAVENLFAKAKASRLRIRCARCALDVTGWGCIKNNRQFEPFVILSALRSDSDECSRSIKTSEVSAVFLVGTTSTVSSSRSDGGFPSERSRELVVLDWRVEYTQLYLNFRTITSIFTLNSIEILSIFYRYLSGSRMLKVDPPQT